MEIYLFLLWLSVQLFEAGFNVDGRVLVRIGAGVFRETDVQRRMANFFSENIFFVQEQHHRCIREPFVVTNRLE
jgi:hypothetical protein